MSNLDSEASKTLNPGVSAGMLALEMWYSTTQCDHASIATAETKAKYQSNGYEKHYTIGYVFVHPHGANGSAPTPPPTSPPMPCHTDGNGCAGGFSQNDILFAPPVAHTGNVGVQRTRCMGKHRRVAFPRLTP